MTLFGNNQQHYYLIGIVIIIIIVLVLLVLWGFSYRSQQEEHTQVKEGHSKFQSAIHVLHGDEDYQDIASKDQEGAIFVSDVKHTYFNNHPNTKMILTYDDAALTNLTGGSNYTNTNIKARHLTIDEVVKCITSGLPIRYPNIFERYERDELVEKIVVDGHQIYNIPVCTTEESCNRQIYDMLLSMNE